jgi:predicted DNA-binding protein (MmcQ/YjbR family)
VSTKESGLSFKSDREHQAILLQQGRFFKTPYIGHHGWVSIKPDEPINWNELSELLKEAYLRAAPKRLVKQMIDANNQ